MCSPAMNISRQCRTPCYYHMENFPVAVAFHLYVRTCSSWLTDKSQNYPSQSGTYGKFMPKQEVTTLWVIRCYANTFWMQTPFQVLYVLCFGAPSRYSATLLLSLKCYVILYEVFHYCPNYYKGKKQASCPPFMQPSATYDIQHFMKS